MAVTNIPEGWVGKEVYLDVLTGVTPRAEAAAGVIASSPRAVGRSAKRSGGLSLGVMNVTGELRDTGNQGVVIRDTQGKDSFYPWGAVLVLELL